MAAFLLSGGIMEDKAFPVKATRTIHYSNATGLLAEPPDYRGIRKLAPDTNYWLTCEFD